ncbi:unnamed protein product [Euphydryas editha]|uniref:PiggyBac transposable element-derived protein domain-containing protein n=1 Tax=Euphydryas editha TaxID=104508 RepID=A0AAU9TJH0_EUPED|nr:unnamed protein product [Euphydryas editha]
MTRATRRALEDGQILDLLQQSDFEDDEDDPFGGDDTDDEYLPRRTRVSDSSTSSESEPESQTPVLQRGRGRAQSRSLSLGRSFPRRGRGHTPRSSSARGRSSNSGIQSSTPPDSEVQANLFTWTASNFPKNLPMLSEPSYLKPDRSHFSNVDFFTQYFDDELIALIVTKTNQTAVSKTGKSLLLTTDELKLFIGLSVIMACIGYPVLRMYWEIRWRIAIVADNMSRNRFVNIRGSLKFVFDDDVTAENKNFDKLWKVRPLLDKITKACSKEVKEQHISIDEMMIPFSGSCGIRQYCPGKPNPVGLKAFVLANSDGTVCDFVVYQGPNTYPEYNNTNFGQGEKPVLKLTETLVPGHLVYFDRYFTTQKLVDELKKRGIESTGTLMKNRIPATARDEIETDSSLKKKGRGSSQVLVRNDDNMAITKWYDNKPVLLLSSIFANEKSDVCRRYNKKEKKYVNVDRPEVIKMYNTHMGGVDLADRMLAVCPARSRTKKWTIRFFYHMIDLALNNAWIHYKKLQEKKGRPKKEILQLRFYKMELAQTLIEVNTAPFELSDLDEDEENNVPGKRKRGRPATAPIPSKLRRSQGSSHLPEVTNKQNRCRMPKCDKKSTVKCTYCDVFLCLTFKRNCFKLFHECK